MVTAWTGHVQAQARQNPSLEKESYSKSLHQLSSYWHLIAAARRGIRFLKGYSYWWVN